MRRLYRTHCFYYFPPEKRSYIDAADLDELWAEQSQKYPSMQPVIMIEDAEQLLMSRGNDNRSAVSSLLEETDGLIRDAYNHQIICTVNCPLDSVDPAIIRPGRLLADWQFRPLSRAEATRLIAARRLNVASKDEMTLAEIFHPVGALNDTLLARIRQHIGFAVPS